MNVEFHANIKGAFGGRQFQTHAVRVELDSPAVLVWDDVAGHYTSCHSLSPRQCRRLRDMPVVRAAR